MAVFNGVTYANGLMANLGILRGMAGYGTQALRIDAALSFDRLIADLKATYGWSPSMTDSYRPLATQERIFKERYEPLPFGTGPFNDVRWYRGVRFVRVRGAAAAVPGTSNHGWGLAVDISVGGFGTTGYNQFLRVAARHGWDNAEGRSVNEAWHWKYNPANDKYFSLPATGTTPVEDDEMAWELDDAALEKIGKAAADATLNRVLPEAGGVGPAYVWQFLQHAAAASSVGDRVWSHNVPNGDEGQTQPAWTLPRDIRTQTGMILALVSAINAKSAAQVNGEVDTAALLEAIRALPAATVAELKERL